MSEVKAFGTIYSKPENYKNREDKYMSRRTAREACFKLLYQIDIHKGSENEILDAFFEENKCTEKDEDFIKSIVAGTLENIDEINRVIADHTIGWKTNRISKVSIAILRIAVFEMLKREDIPASVSINEAVELAKTYDNVKSGNFVNGILGAIQKKLEVGASEPGEKDNENAKS